MFHVSEYDVEVVFYDLTVPDCPFCNSSPPPIQTDGHYRAVAKCLPVLQTEPLRHQNVELVASFVIKAQKRWWFWSASPRQKHSLEHRQTPPSHPPPPTSIVLYLILSFPNRAYYTRRICPVLCASAAAASLCLTPSHSSESHTRLPSHVVTPSRPVRRLCSTL